MDHPSAVRDIDPALYQGEVCFAVTVLDDPIA
jgi:hypothetical protein